jgi:hypothetical protein
MNKTEKLHPHHEALNSLVDKVLAHKPTKGSRGAKLKVKKVKKSSPSK